MKPSTLKNSSILRSNQQFQDLQDRAFGVVANVKTRAHLLLPNAIHGHTAAISCQCLSSDHRWLVTGGEDNLVILWDLQNKSIAQIFKGNSDFVVSVAIHSELGFIASVSRDHILRIWTITTGKYWVLEGYTNNFLALDFDPSGEFLVSGGFGLYNQIKLWHVQTDPLKQPDLIKTYSGHTNSVFAVMFNQENRKILSAGADGRLIEWDRRSGRGVDLISDFGDMIDDFAVSHDNNRIAIVGREGLVKLYNRQGRFLRDFDAEEHKIKSVAFSLDGKLLAAGGKGGVLQIYETNTGIVQSIMQEHQDDITGLDFLNAKHLLSSSYDSSIRIWKTGQSRSQHKLGMGMEKAIRALRLSQNGHYLVSGLGNGQTLMWNLQTGHLKQRFIGHDNIVRVVQLSQDAHHLYTGSWDGSVKRWDCDNGKLDATLAEHQGAVYDIQLLEKEQSLFSSGHDGMICHHQLPSGEVLHQYSGHDKTKGFSVNAQWLAVADGTSIRLWNRQENNYRLLQGHQGEVYQLQLHPERGLLLSCSRDKTVRLWRLDTNTSTLLTGPDNWITTLAVDIDWQYVYACGYDKKIWRWHLDTKTSQVFKWKTGNGGHGLCLDKQHKLLISSDDEGTIRFWRPDSQQLLVTLFVFADYHLWVTEPDSPEQAVFFYTENAYLDKLNIGVVDNLGKVQTEKLPFDNIERGIYLTTYNDYSMIRDRLYDSEKFITRCSFIKNYTDDTNGYPIISSGLQIKLLGL